MLTPKIRFVAVIVVIVCASLGAASGLESKLNISPSTYITRLRSTQEQCPASALMCPEACENKPDSSASRKAVTKTTASSTTAARKMKLIKDKEKLMSQPCVSHVSAMSKAPAMCQWTIQRTRATRYRGIYT